MSTLAQRLGRSPRRVFKSEEIKFVLPDQLMGVEIEVERSAAGTVLPPDTPYGWQSKSDGSLRNGVEYVLASPLKGKLLSDAISAMFEHARFVRQPTSSTHIHVDMTEEDTDENVLQVVFLLAYILEDGIFGMADPAREYCGFTNKLATAPDSLLRAILGEEFKTGTKLDLSKAGSRYYGLNVQALSKYGSLEFRYFPTAANKDELVGWINLVQSFKKAGVELRTIEAVSEFFVNEAAYQQFLQQYFPNWSDAFLKFVPFKQARQLLHVAMSRGDLKAPAKPVSHVFKSIGKTSRFKKFVGKKSATEEDKVAAKLKAISDKMEELSRVYMATTSASERDRISGEYSALAVQQRELLPTVTSASGGTYVVVGLGGSR